MTRLDQAFIKVYSHQDEASPAPPDSPEPASPEGPPGDRPPCETEEVPVGASTHEVLDMLQQTTRRIGRLLPAEDPNPAPPGGHEPGAAAAAADELPPAPAEESEPPRTTLRFDPGRPSGSPARKIDGPSIRPPHVPSPRAEDLEGTAVGLLWPGDQRSEAVANALSTGAFRPTFQVDRFHWPAICCRLGEVAAAELDRMADRLSDVIARGKRVVAVGGCRRGEGATTLLLCLGRRLAQRGVNVLMADANLADPQVACRLGLLPQSGWEDVLAGRLPLEDVVIESAADRLAVLPVRGTPPGASLASENKTRLVRSLKTLAGHYDLVLLDPGPLEDLGAAGTSLACGIGSRLDAIALVHNAHLTPPEDLADIGRALAASQVVPVGVIENFVRVVPPAAGTREQRCTSPIGN